MDWQNKWRAYIPGFHNREALEIVCDMLDAGTLALPPGDRVAGLRAVYTAASTIHRRREPITQEAVSEEMLEPRPRATKRVARS